MAPNRSPFPKRPAIQKRAARADSATTDEGGIRRLPRKINQQIKPPSAEEQRQMYVAEKRRRRDTT